MRIIVTQYQSCRAPYLANSLVIGAIFRSHSLSNFGSKACSSSPSLRKSMKNKLLPLFDKLLLRKRSIIETVHDPLKNISQIEHSHHHSPVNFFVNLIAGLVAYTFREKKPSLNIRLPQTLTVMM
jgi:hypothetical protein